MSEADTMKDRWVPVRDGKRYCSPACGFGCTFEQYGNAHIKAEALCRELGKGWWPHVWENLGWHYRAILGPDLPQIEVGFYAPGHYSAAICDRHLHGNRPGWAARGTTPIEAVEAALKGMYEDIAAVEQIEALIDEWRA